MAKKGRIDSIIDIQKVDKEIKTIVSDLDMLVGRLEGVIKKSEEVNLDFKGAKSLAHLNDTYKKFNSTQQEAVVILDDITKKEKERQKAQEALERQRARGLAQMAKEEAKERELRDAINKSANSIEDLQKQTNALVKKRNQLDLSTKEGIRRFNEYGKIIKSNTDRLKNYDSQIGRFQRNVGNYSAAIKNWAIGLAGALGLRELVSQAKQLVMNIVGVRSEFEKFGAVLTTALGSESMAKQSFAIIREFAKETPFQVQEITNSFVKLVNRGIIPNINNLKSLGDLASSTGKSYDQLVEAILDAQTGEFERLKEFGIRANKEGDKVKFTFKGVEEQVDFTARSIQNYLLSLGDLKGVSGSMEAISETLGGKISNAGDSWTNLLNAIGEQSSGVFSSLVTRFSRAVDQITSKLTVTQFMIEAGVNKSALEKMFGGSEVEMEAANILEIQKKLVNATTEEIDQVIRESSQRMGYYTGEVGEDINKLYAYFIGQLQKMKEDSIKISVDQAKLQEEEDKRLQKKKEEQYEKDKEKQEKQRLEDLEKERKYIRERYNLLITGYQREGNERVLNLMESGESEFQLLSDQLANKEITIEQYNNRVLKLNKSITREQDEIMLESLLQQARIIEASGGDVIGIEKAIFDLKKKMREEDSADIANKAELDLEIELEYQKQKEELIRAGFDTIKSLIGSRYEKQQMELEAEAERDEEAKQRELEAAQGNQAKIDEINAKYADREKKRQQEQKAIRIKQAQADKLFAMFEVAIETAKGVSKAVAASPLTFGLPWSAFVAATGALQLAAIAARPIPKYRKGRQGGPEELAIVGDGGMELIEHQGRHYLTPDSDTLALLPRGANVIPNDETVALLNQMDNHNSIPVFDTSRLEEKIESNFKQLAEVVKNKKEIHLNITEEGMYLAVRNGTNFTKYVNKKILN